MLQEMEIQILSKIQNLINKHKYEDEDDFSVALARAFIKNRDKSPFLKNANSIKTAFFRKNNIRKKPFLDNVFNEISNENIEEYPMFPKQISLDEIDSFSKIRKIMPSGVGHLHILEKEVEAAFKCLIKEPYEHKHWGGENSDGLTTRVIFKGKRIPTAIAFNGRGKISDKVKGLTNADCGDNGDQILRLFIEPAALFILQCVGRIHNSLYVEMYAHAYKKSNGGKNEVYYCLIDGNDTDRIIRLAKGDNHE